MLYASFIHFTRIMKQIQCQLTLILLPTKIPDTNVIDNKIACRNERRVEKFTIIYFHLTLKREKDIFTKLLWLLIFLTHGHLMAKMLTSPK